MSTLNYIPAKYPYEVYQKVKKLISVLEITEYYLETDINLSLTGIVNGEERHTAGAFLIKGTNDKIYLYLHNPSNPSLPKLVTSFKGTFNFSFNN